MLPWLKVALVKRMELLLTITKPGRLLNCELSTDTLLGRFLNARTRPVSAKYITYQTLLWQREKSDLPRFCLTMCVKCT